MAKLTGVTISEGVVTYEGARYEKTGGSKPQVGDILRSGTNYPFMPEGAYYAVVAVTGGAGIIGEDRVPILFESVYEHDGDALFRRVESSTFRQLDTTSLSTAALIELKRCELAALEAQLAEESMLKVGDYARVTGGSLDRDVHAGDIVIITEIDDDDMHPYMAKRVAINGQAVSSNYDWVTSAERLTPAEARAALIAQVNALFDADAS